MSDRAERRWTPYTLAIDICDGPDVPPRLVMDENRDYIEKYASEFETQLYVPASELDALREERDAWQEEAWQCFCAAGEDPDGADARHLNLGEAKAAVWKAQQDEREAWDEAEAAKQKLTDLVEAAVNFLHQADPVVTDNDERAVSPDRRDLWAAELRRALQSGEES